MLVAKQSLGTFLFKGLYQYLRALFLLFGLLFLMFLLGKSTFAAQLSLRPFQASLSSIAVGEQFQLDLVLNTEGEIINALEGELIFPKDLLEVREIRDGKSIVNFWIERPEVKILKFSGIVPGGYEGSDGIVFSVIFDIRREGVAEFALKGTRVLLNDGKGTMVDLVLSGYDLQIGEGINSQSTTESRADFDPPEIFDPIITQDSSIFGGEYFLIFSSQDKGSGIDHYEIKEGDDDFKIAESPYLLKNQELDGGIVVRAVDKGGNLRDAYFPATEDQSLNSYYYKLFFVGSAVLALGLALILFRNFRFREKRIVRKHW